MTHFCKYFETSLRYILAFNYTYFLIFLKLERIITQIYVFFVGVVFYLTFYLTVYVLNYANLNNSIAFC